jgi:hypothetical protein
MAGSAKSTWQVAFHPSTGDHVPYTGHSGMVYDRGIRGPVQASFKPATYTFDDTLEVRSYENVSSGARIVLVDSKARLHTMSLMEFMKHVPHMVGGRITRTWGYTKQGQVTLIVAVD